MTNPYNQESMKIEKVYLVGVHRYCFRAGEKSEIIGVKRVQPSENDDFRLAYKVRFDDGETDLVPLSDVELGNWRYVTALEASIGLLPEVIK